MHQIKKLIIVSSYTATIIDRIVRTVSAMRSQLSRVTELHEHYKRQLEKKDAVTSQTKNIIQLNADYELTTIYILEKTLLISFSR